MLKNISKKLRFIYSKLNHNKKVHSISKDSLNDILYKMPGYIYFKSIDSKYMWVNENLVKFSGLNEPKEMIGKSDYDFDWGSKEADKFVQDDQYVIQNSQKILTEHQLPQKRDDGEFLFVRTEKSPMHDNKGNVKGILAIATDITDQKKLETKLMQETKKAQELDKLKTEFMRNMEHDIRTPCAGIWGMAEYLYNSETDSKRKECLNDIISCSKELLDYCNSILDYSRIESGTLSLIEREFNLKQLVKSTIDIETPAAKNKNLALNVNIDKNIPEHLIGDDYRIKRILINLISNSVKFTDHGYIKLRINIIEFDQNNILLKFIIEDSGQGIPKNKQDYIFERFTRLSLSNQGSHKGIGLGLRIVKQFMHELSGTIELISELNRGTKFICTIPLRIHSTH